MLLYLRFVIVPPNTSILDFFKIKRKRELHTIFYTNEYQYIHGASKDRRRKLYIIHFDQVIHVNCSIDKIMNKLLHVGRNMAIITERIFSATRNGLSIFMYQKIVSFRKQMGTPLSISCMKTDVGLCDWWTDSLSSENIPYLDRNISQYLGTRTIV